MAKGVSIKVQGLKELQKRFKEIPEQVTASVDAEMGSIANEYVNRAVAAAPVDQGQLKNAITYTRKGVLNYTVVSGSDYSPYVEFGTRSRVEIPPELTAYAAQFKGGTSPGDAKKMIYDWCKRKGIDQKEWGFIFFRVMTRGIHPHPFFFPQLPWAKAEVIKQVEPAVKKAIK